MSVWVNAAKKAEHFHPRGVIGHFKVDEGAHQSVDSCIVRRCTSCGSARLYRDGMRHVKGRSIQRYLCRDCLFRFSDGAEGFFPSPDHQYKTVSANDSCRVRVSEEMKNLVAATALGKRAAGATSDSQYDATTHKQELFEYAWALQKSGLAEATIKNYANILGTLLSRGADLSDPESVKGIIVKVESWGPGRKNIAVKAYKAYLRLKGKKADLPRFRVPQKLPFLPTEAEIDALISGSNRKMGVFIQLLKETGMRRGEAFVLRWMDVDLSNRTVKVTPEKGSNPRILRISENLATKLGTLRRDGERVFSYKTTAYLDKSFRKIRRRLAHKLSNPRLLGIHFHTLRHWRGTAEYHRTKDIFHVMRLLGHKNINNTMIYVQMVEGLFPNTDDQYICKVALDVKEASSLVESGYEFVTGEYGDGGKLFRKKKCYI